MNGSVQERVFDDLVDASYNGMLALRGMQVYAMGAALVAGWFVLCNVRFSPAAAPGGVSNPYRAAQGAVSGPLPPDEHPAPCPSTSPTHCPPPVWWGCEALHRPAAHLPPSAPRPWRCSGMSCATIEDATTGGASYAWPAASSTGFNPLVWLAARLSRTDGELACDERVTDGMDARQRRAYASVLVLSATRRDTPGTGVLATGMTMAGSRLKMRVASIVGRARVRRRLAAATVLLACMALVGAFATGEYLPVPAIPSAPQVPRPGALENKDAAVAYAQALWQSADLNQDTAGFAFSASPSDGGGWTVLGSDGESELVLSVDGEGHMISLRNGAVARGRDRAIACASPDHHDQDWYARLSAYLKEFAARVEPTAAKEAGAMKYWAKA